MRNQIKKSQCIISIIVNRDGVAMMLSRWCEHVRKEQHCGANDAGETACRGKVALRYIRALERSETMLPLNA